MIAAADPPDELCVTGMGNSPPARKLACLPFEATMFGSASTSAIPLVCNASRVAPRLSPGRKANRFSSFEIVVVADWLPLGSEIVGGVNWPVFTPARVFPKPELKRLIPACKLLLRSMVANLTFNRICGSAAGTSTFKRLITFPAVAAI